MAERICAIILDYFGAAKTQQCVRSLVGQGLTTVYVLDNSGSQSAAKKLREALAPITAAKPEFNVAILTAGENLGFGRGVNFVLSYDRQSALPHTYYLLVNNDAVAGPGLITNMLSEFQKDTSVALVAPRVVSSDTGREFGIWYHRYFGLLLSRPGLGRFHYFTGCCLLLRKDLLTASGIFDESFFMYGEDVELAWRLTRQGRRMVCAKNAFVEHNLGPSANRTGLFYEYHMVRGHLLLSMRTRKHPSEVPFMVMTKYAALACRAILRCFRHHSFVPLKASLLAGFPLRLLSPNGQSCSAEDRNYREP
jgi:N-acetylglucosaminyl-diphospho-decaprenol L-rhamnosyltransferase